MSDNISNWQKGAAGRRRAKQERPAIPSDRIISTTKLQNGATYTRLKPAYADGTESAEDWRNYNL